MENAGRGLGISLRQDKHKTEQQKGLKMSDNASALLS